MQGVDAVFCTYCDYAPPTMPSKKVIHANVSDSTFEAWQAFSIDNGISVTGVIEALGTFGPIAGGKSLSADQLVKEARKVDSERRRRGGRRS
jgi:hypothetical protein